MLGRPAGFSDVSSENDLLSAPESLNASMILDVIGDPSSLIVGIDRASDSFDSGQDVDSCFPELSGGLFLPPPVGVQPLAPASVAPDMSSVSPVLWREKLETKHIVAEIRNSPSTSAAVIAQRLVDSYECADSREDLAKSVATVKQTLNTVGLWISRQLRLTPDDAIATVDRLGKLADALSSCQYFYVMFNCCFILVFGLGSEIINV
jgi:hypothetical protein